MNIHNFVTQYKNHPILFIGTGFSLRYLKNSYTWDELLSKISYDLTNNPEYYLDIKSKYTVNRQSDYLQIAEKLEEIFNSTLETDRSGKFKEINDIFYENMTDGLNISRFKIYISTIFSKLEYREDKINEIKDLKAIKKNVGSIITTNYDGLIEDLFEFSKLVGNNILLSNPYGSVYKIHGCHESPDKIIISSRDYQDFDSKFELIRAQLLSLFIHNPIIFIGYGVGDENIKNILKTIFSYVEPNSEMATRIKNNFLLVEYGKGMDNTTIAEHDIVLQDSLTIRINKLKTDNFSSVYKAIAALHLPVTALDVRKVQNVMKEIYSGGEIKVSITEDLDTLKNGDKILAIGSAKTIKYHYETAAELLDNYFNIIDGANREILALIDTYTITPAQYYPIFGFSKINGDIQCANSLKDQQIENIKKTLKNFTKSSKTLHSSIQDIFNDVSIPPSYKMNSLIYNVAKNNIDIEQVENYLRTNMTSSDTAFRKLLTVYDIRKFGDNTLQF